MKAVYTLALLALPAFAGFPNGYTNCKLVTTQHTMVSGSSNLTNFPLTVVLTDTDLKTVANGGLVNNSSGYDIGFYTDCSGSGAALSWEMESYSPSTGAIVAHVLRPTLSYTTDDTIGMFYGGAFSSFQSTASAVWDANYKGVWHLPVVGGLSANDSTSNVNNGTNHSATATSGQIDGAAAFGGNGTGQYISLTGTAALNLGSAFTIEAWVYPTADGYGPIVSKDGNTAGKREWSAWWTDSDKFYIELGTNGNVLPAVYVSATSKAKNAWHHVAYIYNGTNISIYVDGASDFTPTSFAGPLAATSQQIDFARRNTDYFTGSLDEVRISNIARSAAWIATQYLNHSAPATYITVGPRLTSTGTKVRHRVISY